MKLPYFIPRSVWHRIHEFLFSHRFHHYRHILSSVTLSYLVLCVLFPDLFLYSNISFIRFADTEINYYGTFSLISNLFHGGIQLWEPYTQMPFAYFYTAVSMLSFSTLWTAAVYSLFAPWVTYPGQFLHVFYSRFYYLPAMIILSVGCYLLFRRFTQKPWLLLLLTVYTESMLVPQMYLGLNTESLFCFFPLLLHFILAFFEKGRFRDAVLAVATFAVCVGMFPLIAVGYFYQGVHFTLLPIVAWWIVRHWKTVISVRVIRQVPLQVWQALTSKRRRYVVVLLGAMILLLVAPHLVLLGSTYGDYDIAHHTSRFAQYHPLHVTDYFQRVTFYAQQSDFLPKLLNFEQNFWWSSWVFMGTTAVFLVLCGVILSTDSRKYIFFFAALSFWLMNSARVMTGWQSIIHWMNALTNPFNVAVRSMHMTGALMMAFVLAPLIAMGLVAVVYPHRESVWRMVVKKSVIILLFGVVVQSASRYLAPHYQWYLTVGFVTCLGILFVRMVQFRGYQVILAMLFCIIIFTDGYAMNHYMGLVSAEMKLRDNAAPGSEVPVFFDYQNPLILPLRTFSSASYQPEVHPTDDYPYTFSNPHNDRDQFLRYTNFLIYFSPPDQYRARHASYSRLAADPSVQQYLLANDRLMFRADSAVPEQEGLLSRLIEKKIEKQVIMVDRDPQQPGIYNPALDIESVIPRAGETSIPLLTVSYSLDDADRIDRDGLALYTFPVPSDFPHHMASGVFTRDSELLQVMVGAQRLMPAQGWLSHPYTFDVQHMSTGKLLVALPANHQEESLIFSYPAPSEEGMGKVLTYRPDVLEFVYETSTSGWLVMQYPYDKKWEVTLDDHIVPVYRVNHSFMGIPVQKGVHTVKMAYWPNFWLRPLVGVAIFLIMTIPFGIAWLGIKGIDEEAAGKEKVV